MGPAGRIDLDGRPLKSDRDQLVEYISLSPARGIDRFVYVHMTLPHEYRVCVLKLSVFPFVLRGMCLKPTMGPLSNARNASRADLVSPEFCEDVSHVWAGQDLYPPARLVYTGG
ncbi:unnamed protein product [Prunus armeniaca]